MGDGAWMELSVVPSTEPGLRDGAGGPAREQGPCGLRHGKGRETVYGACRKVHVVLAIVAPTSPPSRRKQSISTSVNMRNECATLVRIQ